MTEWTDVSTPSSTWILCEAPILEIMAYDIFTSEDSPSMKEFMGNINATEKFTIKDMRS